MSRPARTGGAMLAGMLTLAERLRSLDDSAAERVVDASKRVRNWSKRPTMRQLRRSATDQHERSAMIDDRDNDETRLQIDQRVGCVAVTLVEAVTPSTLARFQRAREALPIERRRTAVANREGGSRTRGGGWTSLGYLRPTGKWVMGGPGSGTDPTLPSCVDAVHLTLHHVAASVDVLVATFVLVDDAGDLSEELRTDYRTFAEDFRIRARGFARVTCHLPWARPNIGYGYSFVPAAEAKARAVDKRLDELATSCRQWLDRALPGRFALEVQEERPAVFVLVADGLTPYSEEAGPLSPIGARPHARDVWTSLASDGWYGSFGSGIGPRRSRVTWLARRDALPGTRDSRSDEEARQNWHVGARFHEEQGPLFSWWGLWRLLNAYEKSLAKYRDTSGASARRLARPVKQARELDRLLTTDGMEVATVCYDVKQDLPSVDYLRALAPDYSELRPWPQERAPARLLDGLHRNLQTLADELPLRSEVVLANARASAELRQAVSNTRLQRVILAISTAALVIGLASYVNSSSTDSPSAPSPSSAPATPSVRPSAGPRPPLHESARGGSSVGPPRASHQPASR